MPPTRQEAQAEYERIMRAARIACIVDAIERYVQKEIEYQLWRERDSSWASPRERDDARDNLTRDLEENL